MSTDRSVYLVHAHRWMYDQLTTGAVLNGHRLAPSPDEADLVIWPRPPWPDPEAPECLADLLPDCFGRLFVFSELDRPLLWAPGVFASVPAQEARFGGFRGGFFVPEQHVGQRAGTSGLIRYLVPSPAQEASVLWSFTGTTSNAPALRGAILRLNDERGIAADTTRWANVLRWHWGDEHREEAFDAFRRYADSIRQAKFVVCPRGIGTSSIRLFEAMQMGRCPVILSDRWLPPPFVDWSKCSIRVSESDVAELPAILRERESEAAELGATARRVWERNFAPEQRLASLIRMCLDIDSDLRHRPSLRLKIAARAAVSYEATWRVGNFLRQTLRANRVRPRGSSQ